VRLRIVLLLLVFCIISNILFAQDVTLSSGTPAEVGMDQTILYAGANMFQKAVENDALRSVVLLVARKGNIVLHEAIGWKDKAKKIPIKKDAMFRMASNTKPVVATGISILVDDEKLNFNERSQCIKSGIAVAVGCSNRFSGTDFSKSFYL